MQLTWQLEELYKTKQDYYKAFEKFKNLCQTELQFKGKLTTRQGQLEYYKLLDIIGQAQDKLEMYLFLAGDLDGSDAEILEMQQELDNYLNAHEQKTLFAAQELKKISAKTLQQWSGEKEFKNYKMQLLHLAQEKKHILSAPQEKLLTQMAQVYNADEVFNTLNDVDIKMGKIKDENGKVVQITQGNYVLYTHGNNRRVRQNALKALFEPFRQHNQTIAANFIGFLKYCNFVSKASKYKNTLGMQLESSHLPQNLPQNVVKNVDKFIPLLHSYFDWRKKFMGIDKFAVGDTTCELFDSTISSNYSLEQGLQLIKKALSPLGEDYVAMLDVAASEHWIDSIERPNKRSGAYSAGLFGSHPYILATYKGTADCVSTIAHEFGHAMHTYYSDKKQPYATHDYDIFVAEIASTVNEILLDKYQIASAKNKNEKIDRLSKFVDGFLSTVFMQTMYTEFELFAHGAADRDEPLTYKKLNDCFDNLFKKYYGKGVIVEDYRKYHWSRVPHFYRPFYVYKYATGYIAACAIVQNITTNPNFASVYKTKFLSAGSSQEPCDILASIGIDILDPKTYQAGFSLMQDAIDQLKELSKDK